VFIKITVVKIVN